MRASKTSLRFRLLSLWALSLVACVAVGVLLVQFYRQSTANRVGRAEVEIARACDLIRDRYEFAASRWSQSVPALSDPALRADLTTAVSLALERQNEVEGGIWQAETGSLAYAYPTYAGTGLKTDLPPAERAHIETANLQAVREERPVSLRSAARGQTLLLHACPLPGPIPRLTAWTMSWVEGAPDYARLRLALGVLLGFMVLMTAWLGRTLLVWARHVGRIETALARAGGVGMPELMIFCLCVMLFHFANAPLLPLVGQKLAHAHPQWADAMMSSCIIAAQMVMLPIAILVGRTADSWGRKPLFLVGFGILPIRAVLYTLSNNSVWLVGVQLLDGVGAGIFGALAPLVIADVMRGTGRFNLAQGLVATLQGIGASTSGLASGVIVDHAGYSAGFLSLGAAAAIAFTVFGLAMPETAPRHAVDNNVTLEPDGLLAERG